MKKKSSHHKEDSGKARHEFPKISRFIPDWKKILASIRTPVGKFYLIVFFLLLLGGVLVGIQFFRDFQINRSLNLERSDLNKELAFWKQVEKDHPDFRDAYYNAAVIEYRLRNFAGASYDLKKALEIDPNFQKGRELERMLW